MLLHLARKHELDLLELPIAFVTDAYLGYLSLMSSLNLDIASEYLVMAATLAHIKSKMLLPVEPKDQPDEEVIEETDPRAELVRRLLEYQKYKAAAQDLASRAVLNRDVFTRGMPAPVVDAPAQLSPPSLFKLLDAFRSVLSRAKAQLAFEVTTDGVSIQQRMQELTAMLATRREAEFQELFEGQHELYDLVITFLALLEMAKRRLLSIYQPDTRSPLYVRALMMGAEVSAVDLEASSAITDASDGEVEP